MPAAAFRDPRARFIFSGMTLPPPQGTEQPTGPLRTRSPVLYGLLFALILAALGYAWFGARARGVEVAPAEVQSGRGAPPPPTAPGPERPQ